MTAEQPDMWWSPTYGLIVRCAPKYEGDEGRLLVADYRSGTYAGRATGSEELPPDAVRLVPQEGKAGVDLTPASGGDERRTP